MSVNYSVNCHLRVSKLLSNSYTGYHPLIRQNKTSSLRLTSLLLSHDLLLIGTSTGVILTLPPLPPLPPLTASTTLTPPPRSHRLCHIPHRTPVSRFHSRSEWWYRVREPDHEIVDHTQDLGDCKLPVAMETTDQYTRQRRLANNYRGCYLLFIMFYFVLYICMSPTESISVHHNLRFLVGELGCRR